MLSPEQLTTDFPGAELVGRIGRDRVPFDFAGLMEAAGLPDELALETFGAKGLSPVLERRSAQRYRARLMPDGAPYDLEKENAKIEQRCITTHGVSFRPSNQKGAGRKADSGKTLERLKLVDYFLLHDLTCDPEAVQSYIVPARIVEQMFRAGLLGQNGDISYAKLMKLLRGLEQGKGTAALKRIVGAKRPAKKHAREARSAARR